MTTLNIKNYYSRLQQEVKDLWFLKDLEEKLRMQYSEQ